MLWLPKISGSSIELWETSSRLQVNSNTSEICLRNENRTAPLMLFSLQPVFSYVDLVLGESSSVGE